MTLRSTTIFAAVITALVLCTTNRAKATLLAYEGFNYPAGTGISGQSGGFGWAGAWATGGAGNLLGTNVAAGLSYTDLAGQSLMTTNGSLVVGNPAGPTATTATPNRTLSSTLAGGTYWISFLYQRLNFDLGTLPYLRQANLGLFAGSGERADIGGPNTSATVSNVFSAWGTGTHNVYAPFQTPNYPINNGTTYFILIKVVADGSTAADTSYVWINWTNLTVEPDISTANLVNNEVDLSSVNTLRFQAGNLNSSGSNAVFQVDELRVGTAFADVTPLATSILPPTITTQPLDQTVTIGDPVAFTVGAAGTFPFSYQWYLNTSTLLMDQTNATLNIPSAQPGDAGGYSVIVSNSAGSVTSRVATLNVHAPLPPTISTQPADVNIIAGNTVTFSVTAAGYAPLDYQWYFNTNTPLAGQTNASLTIPNVQTNNNGGYSVIITNSVGAITSRVATLDAVYVGPSGLPAFSGADGAAKYATGGRGGIVYHVTVLDKNFNDSRPGTLRYGATDANFPIGLPRTIVFDVAGVFWLGLYGAESNYDNGWNATSSRISFNTNITVAGQTAPGPVIIMGGNPHCSGTNVIVRNMMIAPGYGMQGFHVPPTPPTPGTFPDSFAFDAMDIEGQNVMLDHLTAVYATDEAISCNELANYLTIENCNVSQGQNYPQADAESSSLSYVGHALAHLLQAGTGAKISVLNDLYAHQKGRLPRVGSEVGNGPYNDFRNNVFYNWYDTAGTGSSGQPSFDNFINNYYLA
ncbi:MAG: immunoglobulin domain-containing protein, partial [Verrucomicrobiota bacterium]